MSNPVFNFESWQAMFSPEFIDQNMHLGSNLSSPFELIAREREIAILTRQNKLGAGVPVDFFVFASGSLPPRAATRIGGVPYRPRGLAWPVGAGRTALEFLAQVNFSQSKDLVGNLPGDVLLIFAPNIEKGEEKFSFEWYSLGIEDLCGIEEIPALEGRYCLVNSPLTGYIHRTLEYLVDKPDLEEWDHLLQPTVCRIGGIYDEEELNVFPGYRPIFHLESIKYCDYPYPKLPSGETINSVEPLMIGDVGSLTFYLGPSDQLRVTSFSH